MSAFAPAWLRKLGSMSFANASAADRLGRLLLGAAMLAAGWSGVAGGLGSIALDIFGWVPLVTGLAGWCPFYSVLGISTRRNCIPPGGPRGQPKRRP
jgi:hypothetical protein